MNPDELISHGRSRFEHAANKRLLKEKYQAKLTFAHAGGMWQAGPELLATLNCCVMDKDIVILDMYQNPVMINTKELCNLAAERWQEQMNAWLVEYNELNQNR
jgi:hypothetical protein